MYNKRVRALILNEHNQLILIKRVKEGIEPYWVAPGGGVEQADTTLEDAVKREIHEEAGAEISVVKLLRVEEFQLEEEVFIEQYIFLCELRTMIGEPNGPEFDDLTRGQYIWDAIPLDEHIISQMNIRPDTLRSFLVSNARNLRELPDLRAS